MASFEQHINGAVVASGIAVVPLYTSSIVDMNQSLVLLGLGMLGGVLPDLDSDNSKPIQISMRILSLFLPLLAVLALIEDLSLIKILAVWLGAFVFLNYVVFKIFFKFTVHRGIFHSVPMGLFLGLVFIFLFHDIFEYDSFFSTLSGVFIFFGFLVHLLLDELVSLNALGISIKKSFGTALKLYDKHNIYGSISLYVLIAIMLYSVDIDLDVFAKVYDSFENIKL